MNTSKLKFALFGNPYQKKETLCIVNTINHLKEKQAEISIEKEFYDFIMSNHLIEEGEFKVFKADDVNADFVISIGGDGTLLRAASSVGEKNIPIMGINVGRLGFLADIVPSGIKDAIEALYKKQYQEEKHSVIEVEKQGDHQEPLRALNDIAILKRDSASMITIFAQINGEPLVTYQADGLIVSTPTGSTAYSLSNGGPMIVPQTGILCLTPVAPHSLNIRPIVIPHDSIISLKVESRSHNFLIAVDGRSEKLEDKTKLIIRKAPYDIKIIKRKTQSYYATLREKMMWGADSRG